jgi:hypothetical protein
LLQPGLLGALPVQPRIPLLQLLLLQLCVSSGPWAVDETLKKSCHVHMRQEEFMTMFLLIELLHRGRRNEFHVMAPWTSWTKELRLAISLRRAVCSAVLHRWPVLSKENIVLLKFQIKRKEAFFKASRHSNTLYFSDTLHRVISSENNATYFLFFLLSYSRRRGVDNIDSFFFFYFLSFE